MITCPCECHITNGILLCLPCCTPCLICGANVNVSQQESHHQEHEMNDNLHPTDPNTYDRIGGRVGRPLD